MRVVFDTNVLVSALRSRRGASFRLAQKLGSPQFQPLISPPLCLEYEDVFHRPGMLPDYAPEDIGDFLDYLLSVCIECRIHFLWRPHLPDPKDDLVLEVVRSVHHHSQYPRLPWRAEALGIRVVTPDEFLSILLAS